MPTSIEVLKSMCENCERSLAGRKQLCPWRSISNEYCEEYETLEKELKAFSLLKEAYHCKMFYISNTDWKHLKEVKYMILSGHENKVFFITKEEFNLLKEVLESEV